MSFTRKIIDVTITLGTGDFGEEIGPSLSFSGHRVSAQLVASGGSMMQSCNARIYGISRHYMGQLTSIGPINQTAFAKNTIQIAAGDDGEMLTTVFFGSLLTSHGNFQRSPDTYLDIYATPEGLASLKPVGPDSWKGSTPVWLIMHKFATDAGWTMEDKGVKAVLTNPYFCGSTLDKIRACCRAAQVMYRVSNQVLTIWEADTVLPLTDIIEISPASGMVNYPIFSADSVKVRTMFNPLAEWGKKMYITGTEIIQAKGVWNICGVNHSIESETPNGEWFTDIQGNLINV